MAWFRIFILSVLCWVSVQSEEFQFKGVHFLASYCECDPEALTNLEKLQEAVVESVKASGATILDSCSYVFPPDGLTMVLLLSESHASIHTYPERGSCFVDLFTCGDKCSYERFDAALRAYLKPQVVNAKSLLRHEAIEDR